MQQNGTQLSIVIPTYHEVENLRPLTQRIFDAVRSADISTEVIFVDDNSQDGSAELVEQLEADYPVKMYVRTKERGLSTAVLHGFEHTSGKILLVMDADLSHPPDKIPELYELVKRNDADFVIGSRYAEGGDTQEDWPLFRKINSWVATALARPLTPSTDPMAGFFCLNREIWSQSASAGLNPLGYKIGLELMVKARCKRIKEIPILFSDRHAGKSKLTFKQQLLYLMHLKRLYLFKYPVLARLMLYGLPLAVVAALVAWFLAL